MQLEARDLQWGPAARQILNGISIGVGPGEFVGIVGPNGSGKSSLLRCIYRFHRPTAGVVLLAGKDVWRLTAREAAQRTAVVLQELPAEFGLTVEEIVTMGRTAHKGMFGRDDEADRDLIAAALSHVGLDHLTNRQLDTLSGGEKQRVLIARALVQQPQLLILDEPTNHLDIRHQLEVLRMVRGLGTSVLTTIHDLNHAAPFCDRLYVVSDGCVVADGVPDAVLTADLIERVFGVCVAVDRHPRSGRPRITFEP